MESSIQATKKSNKGPTRKFFWYFISFFFCIGLLVIISIYIYNNNEQVRENNINETILNMLQVYDVNEDTGSYNPGSCHVVEHSMELNQEKSQVTYKWIVKLKLRHLNKYDNEQDYFTMKSPIWITTHEMLLENQEEMHVNNNYWCGYDGDNNIQWLVYPQNVGIERLSLVFAERYTPPKNILMRYISSFAFGRVISILVAICIFCCWC